MVKIGSTMQELKTWLLSSDDVCSQYIVHGMRWVAVNFPLEQTGA